MDKLGIGRTNLIEVNKTIKLGIDIINLIETNKVDNSNIGITAEDL